MLQNGLSDVACSYSKYVYGLNIYAQICQLHDGSEENRLPAH